MGRGRYDSQSGLSSQPRDNAAQPGDVSARLLNVLANARADFNHRLNHLRLDLLAEDHLPLFQEFRDVRAQLTRLWVNYLELLFDAEGELIEHMDCLRRVARSA